jgi:hypothetical protein
VRVREAPGRRLRGGERAQELDALLRGGRVGQQAQRSGEPARGARGRLPGDRLAGLAQDGDRREVAVARGLLDVMRAQCGAGAAGLQRRGAALVGGQPPAAGHPLVDRVAHERVAEPEAPRHVGRADEVAAQQVVERLDRRGVRDARRRGRHLHLERVSRDGGAA